MTNVRRNTWLVVVLLAALPHAARAQVPTGVGFQAITVADPVSDSTMPGFVFYPSASASGVTWRGPYEVHATLNAPPDAGARPLVVISHGHGGSELGHHDLAVYLAAHGFVVATLRHPRDNFLDDSGDGHPEVMIGRPIQVQATISMLLGDSRWKTLIDPERIGVAGFSNGGYTSLLLVGAVPQFTRFLDHCEKPSDDPAFCSSMQQAEAQIAKENPGETARQFLTAMQGEIHRWGNTDDPRVKAAFVMAPQSLVFDSSGIAAVNRPVFLYYGEADEVLLPKANVLHIAPFITTLAAIRMIPRAGHYVFLAPCSPQLDQEAPAICRDPAGVDRTRVHARIDADALAFFRKALPASH
jgi:predicted dienelactone hydrolase